MPRFGAEDWITLGLAALAENGEAALSIDALAARAGKTKGGFYHHFKSHDAYLAALIARWREVHVDAPLREAGPGGMAALLPRLDLRIESALRRLAARNPVVADALRRADGARIAFLKSRQADPESDAAADYALIDYAVFVGLQSLTPGAPRTTERLAALTADMITTHWNE